MPGRPPRSFASATAIMRDLAICSAGIRPDWIWVKSRISGNRVPVKVQSLPVRKELRDSFNGHRRAVYEFVTPALEERQIKGPPAAPAWGRVAMDSLRPWATAAGALLVVYLCWRIVAPFLTALCWAFALALIAEPIYAWLLRRALPRSLAALVIIVLVGVLVIGPGIVLAGAVAREASDVVNRVASDSGIKNVRDAIENSNHAGPAFRWLDARYDLPKEAMQIARSVAGWASASVSLILTGSIWALTQIAVTMLVLFYFLRDGPAIVRQARFVIPLRAAETDWLFGRIAQMIRASLGGKIIVAGIQGTLGGLMFGWLGLPAPVFWGSMMALLSIFPIIGAFVIWLPAAVAFALQGDWRHALLLAVWGVLIIHPVDNLLGPMLVGTALRMHTLLMFFSIIGGLAAFGASGVVLGPVTVAVAAGLMELAERSVGPQVFYASSRWIGR
jgi:predicted PurR-regulated permease PerM